jgi:hypothetical protein
MNEHCLYHPSDIKASPKRATSMGHTALYKTYSTGAAYGCDCRSIEVLRGLYILTSAFPLITKH